MVGSLSRRIVLLFNGNGCVEAGLGRIIEHDVISAQLSVQIRSLEEVLGFVYSKGNVSIKVFVGGAGGEACSQAAAFLSPAAGAGGVDWRGSLEGIGSNLLHDSRR